MSRARRGTDFNGHDHHDEDEVKEEKRFILWYHLHPCMCSTVSLHGFTFLFGVGMRRDEDDDEDGRSVVVNPLSQQKKSCAEGSRRKWKT